MATRSRCADPMGRVTTTVFDALESARRSSTDPMGEPTTTTYDADSEVVQTVDPMGRITTATYSVARLGATVTDPLDQVTTYTYNSTGQTTERPRQKSSGGGIRRLAAYNYNADEELTSLERPARRLTSYAYDGLGNVIGVTDPNSNTTSILIRFDERGHDDHERRWATRRSTATMPAATRSR